MTKKIFYTILLSPVFLSCENSVTPNPYQIQIDSTVNAKLAEHQTKVSSQNDSILNALENAKADSMAKSVTGSKANNTIKPNNTVPQNKIGNTGVVGPRRVPDTTKK